MAAIQCGYLVSCKGCVDYAVHSRNKTPVARAANGGGGGDVLGVVIIGGRRRGELGTSLFRRIRLECRAAGSGLRIGEQIETDRLAPSVRERTMKAIDTLGGRVTVGDVATNAGLKVSEAQSALQALAADTGGFLEVSDEGDVLYVFSKDYRSNLLAKSFRLKIEPALSKLKAGAEYLIRVSFGTTLIASLVIVYTSIFVLLSSARSEDDNRNNRGGYSSRGSGFSFYVSPFDLFWYWDPYYYRRRKKRTEGMNFLESVFSFVFGDPDPNEGLDEVRWQAIGEEIAAKGGVVTAEELAPYLDVSALDENNKDDESFVLPVLLRFDGQPEVDARGNIVYRFPSLQRTAANQAWKSHNGDRLQYLQEAPLPFSRAKQTDQTLVVALGAFNLLGVLTLGSLLKDAAITAQMGGLLQFVSNAFPVLQAYTVAFFAIPIFRWFQVQQKNTKIEGRNLARKERALRLRAPDATLREKLRSARRQAERTIIGKDRIVYTTEKDLLEQSYDAADWDRRMEERTGNN
ncbi:uncharacterized protein At5g03900, chloroplastic [Selaginella moellendorffii]|uniref:uncharacterized protein At5g03900, chloroplastic n=1 Tax=Selaginella moellendorffii TaxID=88036 RepID=UPI000D1CB569|nr:uncharacterized protein At5g03900, chloroplastic [Selaginella moellendorffii]|eukprot:XP_024538062.1 uncharacterized protein At5g03900, chloroplastic [Selaginella moellendorffii]